MINRNTEEPKNLEQQIKAKINTSRCAPGLSPLRAFILQNTT